MANRSDFFSKDKSYTSDPSSSDANRQMKTQNGKKFEENKKERTKEQLAADINDIRDFLQDTNTSLCSEDGKLTNDPHRLEKMVFKQQFLVNNDLFNPTEYFGGLEVSHLGETTRDHRLDDMFQQYLSTEMEEAEEAKKAMRNYTPVDSQNSSITKAGIIKHQYQQSYQQQQQQNSFTKNPSKENNSKSMSKVYSGATKDSGKKKPLDFDLLASVVTTQLKGKLPIDKDQLANGSGYKSKSPYNPFNLKPKLALQTSLDNFKPLTSILKKKLMTDSACNKENKTEQSDVTTMAPKIAQPGPKETPTQEPTKFGFRAMLDLTTGAKSLAHQHKSANSSLIRNNRTSAQGTQNSQNRSFNNSSKTSSSNQTNKLEAQTKLQSDSAVANNDSSKAKKIIKLNTAKLETQSVPRIKAKSSERYKEGKSVGRIRKENNNFVSFNSSLTTEDEVDFLFKSYTHNNSSNMLNRPPTANGLIVDDNNYVLKGILSPTTMNSRRLMSRGASAKPMRRNEKTPEQKPQVMSSLKFLNDLLNKRKISYSSSDHLRMPKKSTFMENKLSSPSSQVYPKHKRAMTKSDLFEAKITNQVVKKASSISINSTPQMSSTKKLFSAAKAKYD